MIPTDRQIHAKLYIARTDGVTWVDVSDYLARATINLGDVSGIGTGSGVDGRVRQMEFTLRNDEANSFAPRDRNSSWNQFNSTYTPLLWPYREVELQVAVRGPQAGGTTSVFAEAVGTGDGTTTTFSLDHKPVLVDSVTVYLDGVAQTSGYTVDYEAGTIAFTTAPATGVAITADYTYYMVLFRGYLGDNISCDGHTVTCACRDKAKRLQDTYIETVRQYGSEAGTPAETVIQQILDDNLGVGVVTLSCPVSPGFMVKPYQVEYQSVWDAIQQVASQFGWYLGYVGNTLTLMEPPRAKSTADFALTAADDIYTQQLDINDADIRNVVIITYRNKSTGQRASVTVSDATSIAEYGRRAMQIEEDDASLIDTAAEAQAFANAALADLKDLTGTTRLDMPLLPEIDVFTTISVNDERISSTVDFYAVESVQHTLDWESGKFRTEVVASGRVIGAHARWLEMQTRPGSAGRPATPPTTNQQPATPPTITASANAGAVAISWQPLGDPWVTRYEVWRKAGNYPNDPTGAVKVVETDATSWVDTTGTVGQQYTWYVRAKNMGGNAGGFTTGVVASVPGISLSDLPNDLFQTTVTCNQFPADTDPKVLYDDNPSTGVVFTSAPTITIEFPREEKLGLLRLHVDAAVQGYLQVQMEGQADWTDVVGSAATPYSFVAGDNRVPFVNSQPRWAKRAKLVLLSAVTVNEFWPDVYVVANQILAGDISANRVRVVSEDGTFQTGLLDDGSFGVRVSSPTGSSATLKDGRLTFAAEGISYEYVRRVAMGTAIHGSRVELGFTNQPVLFVRPKDLSDLPYPSENLVSLKWDHLVDWSGGEGGWIGYPQYVTEPITASLPYAGTSYALLELAHQYEIRLILFTIIANTSSYVDIEISRDGATWTLLQHLNVGTGEQTVYYKPNSFMRYLRFRNSGAASLTITISNVQVLTARTLPLLVVAPTNVMPDGFDAHCYAYVPGSQLSDVIGVTKTNANDPWTSVGSDPINATTTSIGGEITITLAIDYPGFPGNRVGYIEWCEEVLDGNTDAVLATYNYRRDFWAPGSPPFSGRETWTESYTRRYTEAAGNYKWRVTLLGWGGNYPVSIHSIRIDSFYRTADEIIWSGELEYTAIDGGVPV